MSEQCFGRCQETAPSRSLWYSGSDLIFRIATAKATAGHALMQPAQRRRRRLAELLPVGTGHPAHMGEAEIEGDFDDARLGSCRRKPRIELGQAKIKQHLRDRHPEMA